MEYFTCTKYVRLRSHHDKYLVPGSDGESVKQSRHGHTRKAQWSVELVQDKPNTILLKSFNNKYLTTSDESFLLGWTGKKVLLETNIINSFGAHWEPIKEEFSVKLRAPCNGKFLRANGGSPPWRNSVTVDLPERSVTRNWIMWTVDVIDSHSNENQLITINRTDRYTNASGFYSTSSSTEEEGDNSSVWSADLDVSSSLPYKSGMDLFGKAKRVRLRSHLDKFLFAEDDKEAVCHDRHGGTRQARWTVEYVSYEEDSGFGIIRLKSCYDKYLTATDDEFLLGVTGKKVKQTIPRRFDSSIEWEPIRDGMHVKLKTRYGNYLRANGGVPPWRNSITHDIPNRSHTKEWILWDVEVLESYDRHPLEVEKEKAEMGIQMTESEVQPFSLQPFSHGAFQSSRKSEGHVVNYNVVDDDGNIVEGENSIIFNGYGVKELTQKLEEETGMCDLTVCSRNPLNGKLYPMKLTLPPNHVTLHVYVVPSSAAAAADLDNN